MMKKKKIADRSPAPSTHAYRMSPHPASVATTHRVLSAAKILSKCCSFGFLHRKPVRRRKFRKVVRLHDQAHDIDLDEFPCTPQLSAKHAMPKMAKMRKNSRAKTITFETAGIA